MALAAQRAGSYRGVDRGRPRTSRGTVEPANHALEAVGLGDARAVTAGALPYGHQRLLEIAMALALEPRLLILDEPTQGLAADEITNLFCAAPPRIRARDDPPDRAQYGRRPRPRSDRHGHGPGPILAEGTPREIEANPDVQRVYLGR